MPDFKDIVKNSREHSEQIDAEREKATKTGFLYEQDNTAHPTSYDDVLSNQQMEYLNRAAERLLGLQDQYRAELTELEQKKQKSAEDRIREKFLGSALHAAECFDKYQQEIKPYVEPVATDADAFEKWKSSGSLGLETYHTIIFSNSKAV